MMKTLTVTAYERAETVPVLQKRGKDDICSQVAEAE